jgi:hypothetical protein
MFERMTALIHATPELPSEADEQWSTPFPRTAAELDAMMTDADRDAAEDARERLRRGEMPRHYAMRLDIVYARAFVSSLRIIRALIGVTGARAGLDLSAVTRSLDAALPHIIDVRDASAHRDERAQGLAGRRREPIIAPIVVVETLHGNNLISTIDTQGEIGHVEISAVTLGLVVDAVQAIIARLPWEGRPRQWFF